MASNERKKIEQCLTNFGDSTVQISTYAKNEHFIQLDKVEQLIQNLTNADISHFMNVVGNSENIIREISAILQQEQKRRLSVTKLVSLSASREQRGAEKKQRLNARRALQREERKKKLVELYKKSAAQEVTPSVGKSEPVDDVYDIGSLYQQSDEPMQVA